MPAPDPYDASSGEDPIAVANAAADAAAEAAARADGVDLETPSVPPVFNRPPLSESDRGRVCRAAIANLMGRDPGIVRVIATDGDVLTLRYNRDDGTVWTNQCRADKGDVSWRAVNDGRPGRWRTNEPLEYAIGEDGRITIVQLMAGEIIDVRKYDVR